MIEFKFNCPACGQHILANDAYSGRQIDCPTCRAILVVPAAPGALPPSAPTAKAAPPPPTQPAPAPAARQQRPLPPVKKSGIKWLIIGGAVALVIAAGLVVVYITGTFSHGSRAIEATDKSSPVRKVSGAAATGELSGPSATEIVQKVGDQYASFTTYSAEGTGVAVVDMSKVNVKNIPGMGKNLGNATQSKEFKDTMSKPIKTESDFTVKLGRPNLYRVEWSMNAGGMVGVMKGATWSAGEGDFILVDPRRYSKMESRELALASATGVSGGSAATIPGIFFNDSGSMLAGFKTGQRTSDEIVDGDDCYVIKSKIMGMQTTLWITKDTYLIKQKQMIFGGKSSMPEMSDKQIDEQLKKMGDMSPAAKAQAKAAMKQAKPMMEQMKGQMTETYHNITTNKSLSKSDFKYDLPAGAVLAKSLF